MMDINPKTNAVEIECACKFCKDHATRKGLPFPMRALVNPKMNAVCGSAKGRHAMVRNAHQPLFGSADAMQQRFGPWKV